MIFLNVRRGTTFPLDSSLNKGLNLKMRGSKGGYAPLIIPRFRATGQFVCGNNSQCLSLLKYLAE
jgi:hypothetical protein